MSIRIGILGYGNLGRGVECAVTSVTLLQLEDEIMEIAPQLSDICKKISDILA